MSRPITGVWVSTLRSLVPSLGLSDWGLDGVCASHTSFSGLEEGLESGSLEARPRGRTRGEGERLSSRPRVEVNRHWCEVRDTTRGDWVSGPLRIDVGVRCPLLNSGSLFMNRVLEYRFYTGEVVNTVEGYSKKKKKKERNSISE